ncbi:uncharacterized protein LOC6552162 [Drosophila erecta]|uniref:GG17346 n=1 Tax=Drosophila erecta TaxID=7220 RepID=B3P4L9_DROER|nr:uncharacterized protein LOC6552162 [Drosophila erecta]EDV49672.1 uncharacterized protein Dere_GG17346 [Drosophila erecta]
MADAEEVRPIQLLDLPVEILEMVMTHLDLHRHKLMREVSEQLKQISTAYILHRHRSHEVAHRERPAESVRRRDERIKLQIMRSTCCYFIDEDTESDFALCLLYFHDKQFEYSLKANHLSQFVVHFLRRKEQPFNVFDVEWRNRLKVRRFHYAMTVLGLVRQFENVKILNSTWGFLAQNLEVELPNTFIGVIDEVCFYNAAEANRRISFLAVLAELLFYEKTKTSYTGQKNFEGTTYTYIIQPNSTSKRSPRTVLKFSVDGPESLFYFMRNFITGDNDPNTWIHLPPKTDYGIRIEVKSFQGPQFVYFGDLNINVLKSSELNDFYESDPINGFIRN